MENQEIITLNKLRDDVIRKAGFGKTRHWVNRHYIQLADAITDATGIQLSVSSLRRLFEGNEKGEWKHQPQAETRNALARFVGYDNWNQYFQARITEGQKHPIFRRWKIWMAIFLGSFAIGGAWLIFKNQSVHPVTFNGKYLYSDNFPHSVVFNYDISSTHDGQVFINFSDAFCPPDENRIPLDKSKHTVTHLYALPDYYQVHLRQDGKDLATTGVHILTHGWKVFAANSKDLQYVPVVGTDTSYNDGMLYTPPEKVQKSGIDILPKYWVKSRLLQEFDAELTDFRFETRVMNAYGMEGPFCQSVTLFILGETGRIAVKITNEGCFGDVFIEIGQKRLEGQFNDFSALGVDLSDWRNIGITSKDGQVMFQIDHKVVFTDNLEGSYGHIKGILFDTEGSGAMDFCRLFDGNGTLVYDEEF